MSSFTRPLVLEVTQKDKRPFRVVERFGYIVEKTGSSVVVPAGFLTDGATVPFPLNAIVPAWGRHGKAAVVHDYMYRSGDYSREFADYVFLEAMGVLGVPKWRKWLMYLAVRMFGWIVWNRLRKNETRKR